MSASVVEKLESAGLRRGPEDGVNADSPDGAYFFLSLIDSAVQIVILGPMPLRPSSYASFAGRKYRVREIGALPIAAVVPKARRQSLLDRGIWSIILEEESR